MRSSGRARVDVALLGALAAVPLLAYLVYLAGHPVERFALGGDYARLELDIRHVGSGTLLGAYSRFHFSHPGPLWFYLAAPVYALTGRTSTGLYAAACVINMLCAAATVAGVRALSTGAHAIATLIVVVAWLGAFGDLCALPWNPLTVALPLVAFLVWVTLFARGASVAAVGAVFFGALAMQTHLATAPVVLVIAFAAAIAFGLGTRGRAWTSADKRHVYVAVGLAIVLFVPPIVEQLIVPDGNLGRIAQFFANRPEPPKPIADALHGWAYATSWLPDRLFNGEIAKDGYEPLPMGSHAIPRELSVTATRLFIVSIVAFAGGGAIAVRRRDGTSLAFLATGLGASALAVLALTRVVGPELHYLFFWTTAATTVAWIGVVGAIASAIHAKYTQGRGAPAARTLSIVIAIGAALGASALQRPWIAKGVLAPAARPHWRAAYTRVHDRIVAEKWTPVVHTHGAWDFELDLLLELERDGLEPQIVDRDRWLAGRQHPRATDTPSTVHLWVGDRATPIAFATCLSIVADEGDVTIYSSAVDVRGCD